ncbi:hypothetical protein NMY22_g17450 [Coprinellus aureogranulatus]|nr:hypothetical protein NMY22_g17450 [Coprinellus aureogranulatus]
MPPIAANLNPMRPRAGFVIELGQHVGSWARLSIHPFFLPATLDRLRPALKDAPRAEDMSRLSLPQEGLTSRPLFALLSSPGSPHFFRATFGAGCAD